MHGITTSIRLPPKLSDKLDKATHTLHQGKNWIIKQALEEYLSKLDYSKLAKEARRQSILASQTQIKETNKWADNSDTSGWK